MHVDAVDVFFARTCLLMAVLVERFSRRPVGGYRVDLMPHSGESLCELPGIAFRAADDWSPCVCGKDDSHVGGFSAPFRYDVGLRLETERDQRWKPNAL